MKKFQEVIGIIFIRLISLICIVAITSVIVVTYYEEEKDELFFEAMDSFNSLFEVEKQMIYENHGLLHHETMKLNRENEIINI